MGLFKKQTDSIRNAMFKSYEKHVRLAKSGRIGDPEDSSHMLGLYGALGSRNKVCGLPFNETIIFSELAPFLELDEEHSIKALCEYAVWRELATTIELDKKYYLENKINEGIKSLIKKESPILILIFKMDVGIPWRDLIDEENISHIISLIKKYN